MSGSILDQFTSLFVNGLDVSFAPINSLDSLVKNIDHMCHLRKCARYSRVQTSYHIGRHFHLLILDCLGELRVRILKVS